MKNLTATKILELALRQLLRMDDLTTFEGNLLKDIMRLDKKSPEMKQLIQKHEAKHASQQTESRV